MRTKPRFRFKIALTMVVGLFVALVVQGRAWFHARDFFFGTADLQAFVDQSVISLLWQALPILLVLAAGLYWRLGFLEDAVGRLASGQTLSSEETQRAKKNLLAIPTWVFIGNFGGFGLGILFQVIFNPGLYLSLVGILNVLFYLAAGGLFSWAIMGIFDFYLTVPRSLLHVTTVDDSLGVRQSRHRVTTVFVLFLISWLLLYALMLGINFSQLQIQYTQALQRVVAGEDRQTVSTEFFDMERLSYPQAGKAQNDDLLAVKPDLTTLGWYYTTGFFFLLALGGGLWWVGTYRQAKELGTLRDRLNQALIGGDLRQKLEIVQFDEVGELASAINTLTETQADRIARLTSAASAVEAAIRPLAEATEKSNRAAGAIVASTAKIAKQARQEIDTIGEAETSLAQALASFEIINTSVESQAGFVSEASSAITEMASSIASVTKTTDDARTLTERLKQNSQRGNQSLEASVQAIRAIEAASEEVNTLTAAIAKISAQTNLLAMNAAIEAAHAGETGAGFAVVAQEVRNLALSSAESNKRIKQKITEMLALVGNGVKLTAEVGQAFEQINADITSTATLVSEINSAMQEQNVGTSQILQSTASLVDASRGIQKTAETQKEQNAQLREAVGRITTSFHTIHQGAQEAAQDGEQIRESMARLEEVARGGQAVVYELAELVSVSSGALSRETDA